MKQTKAKKGDLTSESPIKLLIGVAVTIGLLLLFFTIIDTILSPNFDKEEETAKAYLNTFHKQLQTADKGETGEFKFWNTGADRKKFFLVYFGERSVVRGTWNIQIPIGTTTQNLTKGAEFALRKKIDNAYCMCFIEEERGICNTCGSAQHPITTNETIGIGTENTLIISQEWSKETIHIKKEGDTYTIWEKKT